MSIVKVCNMAEYSKKKLENKNKKKIKTFSCTDESVNELSNLFKDNPAPEIKEVLCANKNSLTALTLLGLRVVIFVRNKFKLKLSLNDLWYERETL